MDSFEMMMILLEGPCNHAAIMNNLRAYSFFWMISAFFMVQYLCESPWHHWDTKNHVQQSSYTRFPVRCKT